VWLAKRYCFAMREGGFVVFGVDSVDIAGDTED